jgi:anti-sigma factor RsiW
MTHEEAFSLLAGYVDSELNASSARELTGHLAECEGCREEYALMQEARMAVRSGARYHRAPDFLRAAAGDAGSAGSASLAGPRDSARAAGWADRLQWLRGLFGMRWTGSAVAAGLGAVVASAVTLQLVTSGVLLSSGVSDRMADELVSNHVRSLITDHLMDVVSTDKHTVKPWFAGRIDFSPPVEDFAAKGFPLAGGRLEYLEDRPAAALVYRRGPHYINVYVRPEEGGRVTELTEEQRRGFNLLDWSDGRFVYDIVSDANPVELRELARDIAESPAR